MVLPVQCRVRPRPASGGTTSELGRIWSGRLSRGDERWPDESRCPLGLRKFSQHFVTVLPGKHPLEASLETNGCKHAKESPFVGSKVSQRVGYVLGRACPCARTTGNDVLANLQGQLTGEHVEGLRVRGMQVQRRPGDTRGEGHLHHTQSSVAVCFTQQDSQRLRDTRPPKDHARTTRHLKLRLLNAEIGSVFTGQSASPPTTDKLAIRPTMSSFPTCRPPNQGLGAFDLVYPSRRPTCDRLRQGPLEVHGPRVAFHLRPVS